MSGPRPISPTDLQLPATIQIDITWAGGALPPMD